MATVTSSFSSLSTMYYGGLITSLGSSLHEAIELGTEAWDNANLYAPQTINTQTSDHFNALLTNGDSIDFVGSGFLTSTWQVSAMTYVFDATHSVQATGSVTIHPNTSTDPTGSFTEVIYHGPAETVTLLGFDNVGLDNAGYITKAIVDAGAAGSVVYEGTIYSYGNTNVYSFGFSGTITKVTYSYAGHSIVITDIFWDITQMLDVYAPWRIPPGSVDEALTWAMSGNDFVTGSAEADALYGFAGDDTLDGLAGADRMFGGTGGDTYYVDTQSDLVFEFVSAGTDTVMSTTSFYLYQNIENLTLIGVGADFGVGNALNNVLTGSDQQNLLIGWDGNDEFHGGGERDALFGGDGNDTLYGDAGIDYIVAGLGNDTVYGGNDADEVYSEAGDDLIYGGDDFATDILVGGDGNDTIDGGPAWDLMYGNAGDDVYYVSQQVDWVFEQPGEGTDTVIADSPSGYYLYENIENLVLMGNTPFGVGNELDNTITGSSITNVLLGGMGNDTLTGGAGNDVLWGQGGADVFVLERGTNADAVGDFTPGVDKLKLLGIGYASFADVEPHLVEYAGTAAIDLGSGDIVVLDGVPMASLSAGDFLFT